MSNATQNLITEADERECREAQKMTARFASKIENARGIKKEQYILLSDLWAKKHKSIVSRLFPAN